MKKHIYILLTFMIFSISSAAQSPYIDSLKVAYHNTEGEDRVMNLLQLSLNLMKIEPDKAVKYIEEGRSYVLNNSEFNAVDKSYNLARFLSIEVQLELVHKNLDKSFQKAKEILVIAEQIKDDRKPEILAKGYRGIGDVYLYQFVFNEAITNYKLAEEALINSNQANKAAGIQAQLSQIYLRQKDFNKSLLFINKALENTDKVEGKNSPIYGYYTFMKMHLLNRMEDFKAVLEIGTPEFIAQAERLGPINYGGTIAHTASAYAALGNEKEANKLLKKLSSLEQKYKIDELTNQYLYVKYQSNFFLTNYKEALADLVVYNLNEDSIRVAQNEKKLLELQTKYESDLKESKIATLEQKAVYNQKIMLFGGGIFSLFLLSTFLFFKNISQKRKNNQKLAAKEKELIESKERLFTNITHEIKTPLSLIISPLKELQSKQQSPEEEYKVNLALNNSQKLLKLVNQILDWHSLEANLTQINPIIGQPKQVIKQTVQLFSSAASEKQINIEMEGIEEEIYLKLDFDKFEKILSNLISNAIKYTPATKKIKIHSAIENNKLVVSISDTGQGISAQQQNQIFQRFNRSDKVLDKEGNGIGLAIVKELTNLMQGDVSLRSQVNKGTTVKITLPFEAVNSPLSSPVKEDETQQTIFIIEDNFQLRNYIVHSLSKHFKIESFSSAEAALERLKEEHPDILLSDVMLPGIDGIEFCQKVKSDENTAHLPLILLTAKPSENNKLIALKQGADVWMNKPFEISELQTQINNLLQSRKKTQEKYSKDIRISFEQNEIKLDNSFLEKVLNSILYNISEEALNVEYLAKQLNISRFQLAKKIKSLTNKTAVQFIRETRIEKARILLLDNEKDISEIAYAVGFKDPNYFSSCFKNYIGTSPSEWRKTNAVSS